MTDDDITAYLDRSEDPVALLLASHLLIEVRLRAIVAGASNAPDELQEARLSFHQMFAVARAIVGRHGEPVWGFMRRLNEVRDRVVHHLEPGDLDELIGSLVDRLSADGRRALDTPINRLRAAAYYSCGYLDAIGGSRGSSRRTHRRSVGQGVDRGETVKSVIPQCAPVAVTLVREPFHRDRWVFEEKVDGWRILATRTAGASGW